MPRVILEALSRPSLSALVAATLVCVLAPDLRAQDSGMGGSGGAGMLPLVTETVVGPKASEREVHYWWKNATEPKWSGTDAALESGFQKTSGHLIRPAGDVRISRIYRTPELSLDNAAALASIIGARRILVGEVRYRIRRRSPLPGIAAVHADATLQIVDAASSEPTPVQTIEYERSVYGNSPTDELLDAARERVGTGAAELVGRAVTAVSGPVGVGSNEPFLAFHAVTRGEALVRIRRFLSQLDVVDAIAVRWASEGIIALEVNPGERDEPDAVDYAARTLVNHDFDRMTVSRRQKSLEGALLEFRVDLAEGFGEPRDGEKEDGRGGK